MKAWSRFHGRKDAPVSVPSVHEVVKYLKDFYLGLPVRMVPVTRSALPIGTAKAQRDLRQSPSTPK